jgi:hypothetical protein
MACMLTDWIAEGIRPEEIFIYPTH